MLIARDSQLQEEKEKRVEDCEKGWEDESLHGRSRKKDKEEDRDADWEDNSEWDFEVEEGGEDNWEWDFEAELVRAW